MKIPFKFKNIHSCEAAVLTCIDFRFWKETIKFVEEELKLGYFDFPSLPGSAKAINEGADLALECISVPCDLHHVKKIVIVNHADCGAYGGSAKFNGDSQAEQKFHEEELKKAKEIILSRTTGDHRCKPVEECENENPKGDNAEYHRHESVVRDLSKYPDKEVILVYAGLVDDSENIEFSII